MNEDAVAQRPVGGDGLAYDRVIHIVGDRRLFRAERGGFPTAWASHLALTDETFGTFDVAQRSVIGPAVDVSGATGFAFSLPSSTGPGPSAWKMTGIDGRDHLAATADPSDTGAG